MTKKDRGAGSSTRVVGDSEGTELIGITSGFRK